MVLDNAQKVIGIELSAAAQAIWLRQEQGEKGIENLAPATKVAYDFIRTKADPIEEDIIMIDELKKAARAKNYKPEGVPVERFVKDADLKKISVDRLTARLGLTKYDLPAPMSEEEFTTKKVKILLSQHIGAPAVPAVKVGDRVTKGQRIGTAKEGALSVALHASIDGVVDAVTERYIRIKK